ncbi:acylneuraminate cytidylyltransferase family protein [Vulcanococcus sp. Clear-D1]|jgi:CMP-N-acetylneuraminic acid synthetase|uniref:acylneuraminate cytidylyltransferase family protein n=1 Tax=Vulcanococcus sp. Clear-D1 TaxID=2766970 RepID=UPI0019B673F7|nr:acylneuraminate cytidylyltransferase family protein [Vulcanococcus sp. Clear-D1]MBD1195018.1 acylneuraminate cytidylyltransferase family protein [Vulcanococcus sp. Clear-D1]
MSIISLIPARGGSKGIPNKNLRTVGNIPLLARTIQAAQSSEKIQRTYVSSDSPELLALAQAEGARTIQRPPDIAGDTASSESALIHALDVLASEGLRPEVFVFLQCTSPFTRGREIDLVVERLQESGAAMAFSASPWHGFLWSASEEGWGIGVNHNADAPRPRRQDLPPCWLETGAIYAIRTEPFVEAGHRFVAPRLPVPIDGWHPEIDTPYDLTICDQAAALFDQPT